MDITTIGIDIAKRIFQLHGIDKNGRVVLKKKLIRNQLLNYMANLPKCLVGIEACGGANYWGREITKLGHEVKLMAPQFVKHYVKTKDVLCNPQNPVNPDSEPSFRGKY